MSIPKQTQRVTLAPFHPAYWIPIDFFGITFFAKILLSQILDDFISVLLLHVSIFRQRGGKSNSTFWL